MEYKVDYSGMITDDTGREIGPAVSNYAIRHTAPMAGWNGVHVRLWGLLTGGRDDVGKIAMKHHNVQFKMDADKARALAHAILAELDRHEWRDNGSH